jgi:hypothetical protein
LAQLFKRAAICLRQNNTKRKLRKNKGIVSFLLRTMRRLCGKERQAQGKNSKSVGKKRKWIQISICGLFQSLSLNIFINDKFFAVKVLRQFSDKNILKQKWISISLS